MVQSSTFFCAIAILSTSFLAAQDSRTVSEPVVPPICASVDAQLSIDGRSLSQVDEGKLDTARIQKALDAVAVEYQTVLCGVELHRGAPQPFEIIHDGGPRPA